jgi:hypothetical protein
MTYTGQTGRTFSTHYKEHRRHYSLGHYDSKFAEHLLKHRHSFGPIESIMTPIHFISKGKHMNTVEKFHIFVETKRNNQINDKNTVQPNAIFETLDQLYPS